MMKRFLMFVLIILYSTVLFGARAATLTEFFNPTFLAADEKQLYIVEGTTVFIYSLNNFKLKGKFGKPGEGPQEFLSMGGTGPVLVYPRKNYLMISSTGKISYFTKDGKFIREVKMPSQMMMFFPVGDKFLMAKAEFDAQKKKNKTVNYVWSICDEQLKKLKDIGRTPHMKNGGFLFPAKSIGYIVCDDKIIAHEPSTDICFSIYDKNGNKTASIKRQMPVLKVTQDYKDMIYDEFRHYPEAKDNFEAFKQMIKFENEFPAVQNCIAGGNRILIFTFKENSGGFESFVYDSNGKFIKQINVNLKDNDNMTYGPMTLKNYQLYQLIENQNNEAWELHVTNIK